MWNNRTFTDAQSEICILLSWDSVRMNKRVRHLRPLTLAEWPLKGRSEAIYIPRIYWLRRSTDDNVRVRVIDTILTIHDAVVGRVINPRCHDSFRMTIVYSHLVGNPFEFTESRYRANFSSSRIFARQRKAI